MYDEVFDQLGKYVYPSCKNVEMLIVFIFLLLRGFIKRKVVLLMMSVHKHNVYSKGLYVFLGATTSPLFFT